MRGVTQIALLYAVSIAFGYAQTNCGLERFRCHSGECIAGDLLCDGRPDCSDGSDETRGECTKPEILCPDYAFRCKYGACVNGDAACNGVRDCVDNSDETLPQCSGGSRPDQPSRPSRCRTGQFMCDNGQCIADTDVCDGTRTCMDGSDETSERCDSLPCTAFRCTYGACIDRDLRCNGVNNCADGSDEDPQLCGGGWPSRPSTSRPITPRPTSSRPSTSRPTTSRRPTQSTRRPTTTEPPPILTPSGSISCIAPPQPENGRWTLHRRLCTGRQNCVVPEGTELPAASHLIYSCNEGHKLNGSANVICNFEGKWANIPECTEIRCKALTSGSTEATCTYLEEWVSCDSPVRPRTRATLKCRNSYRRESDLQSETVRCNDAGNWDPEPIRCIPACGTLPSKNKPLIVGGHLPNITDFPWHASLYRGESKEYICGASIIKENLLVTAAHCVYDESSKRVVDATRIYVAAGNLFRDYDFPHDENIVQKRQGKNIYMCYYIGAKGNHASDIAILEINRPFELSAFLVPICIDLFNDLPVIKQGNLGKVAGFGRTSATANSSTILQALWVPYISIDQCRSVAQNADTEQYVIPHDKFCAGYTNGSSACDGDSGSGLAFAINNLWYLQGIVSSSLGAIQDETTATVRCNNNLYTVFTRVSSHVPFIQNVILKLERQQQPSCSDRLFQ